MTRLNERRGRSQVAGRRERNRRFQKWNGKDMSAADRDIVIGIDLGTTNSLVAVCDEAGPRLLRDNNGEGLIPSFLAFSPDGRVLIGQEAKAHAVENPTSTIFSIKRLMGRGFDELTATGELAQLPYAVVQRVAQIGAETRDMAAVEINGRLMTPPELSALILREMRERATRQLGREVRKAVITVPAYFDDAQRQATRDAGRIAGLEVLRIINEPTAAALAYGLGVRGSAMPTPPRAEHEASLSLFNLASQCPSGATPADQAASTSTAGESLIAVYDLGGGTFDVSILRLMESVFEVLSTHGDTRLGGDDLDREIIHLVQREVQEQFGLTIDSPATRQALRTLAENVKVRLSTEPSAKLEIDLAPRQGLQPYHHPRGIRKADRALVERTINSCRHALADAKLEVGGLDQVVMVGGSTRIPLVRKRVEEAFGRRPYTAINRTRSSRWGLPCRRASSGAYATMPCCSMSSPCRWASRRSAGDGQAHSAEQPHPLPGDRAVQHFRGRPDQRADQRAPG
jgi:molecular chaperone DnaK (HSP70)